MMQKRKYNKSTKKDSKIKSKNGKNIIVFSKIRIIIFLIIVALTIVGGFVFKEPIEATVNQHTHSAVENDLTKFDDNGLSVHFVNVGQGDSIAIRFPDNKTMLVDAGTTKSKESLVKYLKNNFFKDNEYIFDYVLLTHSDADHCGGMAYICKNFVINTIYRPYMYCKYPKTNPIFDETEGNETNKNVCTSATYYNTITAFNSEINQNGENATIVWTDVNICNSTYKISGVGYSIDFYGPSKHYLTKSAGTIANDFSPIMVLNYNGKKIMLTGDASTTAEQEAMSHYSLPDIDLLKVGHHGSRTSSGTEFLNQIKPEISIISVGKNNSYKHPTKDCLNRLNAVGSQIYRTDYNGNIVANITSAETSELNIYIDMITYEDAFYINIEYIMLAIIITSLGLCFGIKIKY